jgi:sulfatase maturation enzyme AslB (radical SAM superfamily)
LTRLAALCNLTETLVMQRVPQRTHLPVIDPPRLIDAQARAIRYLRVSLTDRCNYRCVYCMPEGGVELGPRDAVLSFEEIERLVRVFAGLGVRRVRLTGGEPPCARGWSTWSPRWPACRASARS